MADETGNLFEDAPRGRKPNKVTTRAPLGHTIIFTVAEYKQLQRNLPGPGGLLGGYPRLENHTLDITDPETRVCFLEPVMLSRVITYCQNYGGGGPNKRLRTAFIPALRRIRIDIDPDWRTD